MSIPPSSAIPDRPRTLAEKVWDDHLVVKGQGEEPDLIYIDLHLVHEVTSPQAFDGLRARDLVHQVQVDVQQVGLARRGVDDVPVPHLLGQGLGRHDVLSHFLR